MPLEPHLLRSLLRRPAGARLDPGPVTEKEVVMYRVLAGLAIVPVLAFGLVYRHALPGAVDPWRDRFAVAGACVAFLALTYAPRHGGRAFLPSLHVLFVAITGWVLRLLWLNGFAAEYALGLLVVVSVIAAVFRSPGVLVGYGAATFAAVAAVAALAPAPRLSPMLFLCYLIVILALFLVAVLRRLRAEGELAASEARYALAARGSQDGLWDWDVRAGTLHVSSRWREIVGGAPERGDLERAGPAETAIDDWLARVHPADRARVLAELSRAGAGSDALFELEHRVACDDGGWRWALVRGVRVVDDAGAVARVAGSLKDISDRKREEARLVHDAMHDSLTGLPNRGLFLDRLAHAIAHTKRHPDARFAVIFLDVDRFKVVNDRLGHIAADRLLVSLARRLQHALREEDTIARLGGDEFALLLEGVADPTPMAERLQESLRAPFEVDGQHVVVTASFGIAISSTGFARPEDVLRDADAAMYRAKGRGRARFEIADAALHAHSRQQLALEGQLREAAERGELRMHYQPVVRLDGGAIVGFEALLRWQHPERGLRGPDEFIPLAEQTGMIVGVGRWALREACREMQAWRVEIPGADALWLSVNLSSRQLLYPQLVQEVLDALDDTGFPADRLRLEITESVIMDDPTAVGGVLHLLREAGIRIAIDDFGTGYSSLAYLHRLPLDTLKIDRSFVRRMTDDPALEAVVATIVSLSDCLRLDTVAEGVETEAEARALVRLGCELGQGFLFARALPPDAARALVAEAALAVR